MKQAIVDTGPLVAFIDGADRFHGWSAEALGACEPPLATCEAVVAEAWHLLRRAKRGRDMLVRLLESRLVAVRYSLASDTVATFKLMTKYADVPMSVADACLVRMVESHPGATIITLDSDFRVYRRGRAALRILTPPR